jgi:hypothetical protein
VKGLWAASVRRLPTQLQLWQGTAGDYMVICSTTGSIWSDGVGCQCSTSPPSSRLDGLFGMPQPGRWRPHWRARPSAAAVSWQVARCLERNASSEPTPRRHRHESVARAAAAGGRAGHWRKDGGGCAVRGGDRYRGRMTAANAAALVANRPLAPHVAAASQRLLSAGGRRLGLGGGVWEAAWGGVWAAGCWPLHRVAGTHRWHAQHRRG